MNESNIKGITIRAILVFCLTWTVCWMSTSGQKVEEPLYSGFLLALGFFFGQKTAQQNGGNNEKLS